MNQHQKSEDPCPMVKELRPKMQDIKITPGINNLDLCLTELIANIEYDILPLFERMVTEHSMKKHYSLRTNKKLNCLWKEFKNDPDMYKNRKTSLDYDQRDYHFYNYYVRYFPASTLRNKAAGFKLSGRCGMDERGALPLPHEMWIKRGCGSQKAGKKKVKKDKMKVDTKSDKDDDKSDECKCYEDSVTTDDECKSDEPND